MISAAYESLSDYLRQPGCLWHRTTVAAIIPIIASKKLLPNDGSFQYSFPQSKCSYAHMLRAVALFDFETASAAAIADREYAWGGCLFDHRPGVLIRLDRAMLDPDKLILPDQIAAGDPRLNGLSEREKFTIIPDVEALYVGAISAVAFKGLTLLDHLDGGGFRFVHFDSEAVDSLLGLAADWQAENEAHLSARHQAGQYTLDEAIRGVTPPGWDLSQLWTTER